MLISEGLFAAGGLVIAYRMVGGFGWRKTFAAPLIAAAVMLAATLAIRVGMGRGRSA